MVLHVKLENIKSYSILAHNKCIILKPWCSRDYLLLFSHSNYRGWKHCFC